MGTAGATRESEFTADSGEQKHKTLAATTTRSGSSKANIPRTRHSWWSLDEFAIEMLNYGLALLRGLHSKTQHETWSQTFLMAVIFYCTLS